MERQHIQDARLILNVSRTMEVYSNIVIILLLKKTLSYLRDVSLPGRIHALYLNNDTVTYIHNVIGVLVIVLEHTSCILILQLLLVFCRQARKPSDADNRTTGI